MSRNQRFTGERIAALPELLAEAQARGIYVQRRDGTRAMSSACSRLVAELWAYAYPALQGLLRDGQIEAQVKRLGLGLPWIKDDEREAILTTEAHRVDLVGGMLVRAVPRFLRRVVTNDKFDASRSSLVTHFMNGCICAYPDALREWVKERRELVASADERWMERAQRSTTQTVEQSDLLRRLIEAAPQKTRTVLHMVWEGYTYKEIAEELQLNPSTVRTRVYEFRCSHVLPEVIAGRIIPPRGHALKYYGPTEEDEWW